MLAIANSLTFTDPGTGTNRTETVALEVIVPSFIPYGSMQLKVVVQIFPPPPAWCNCAPWCAIGFGTLNGTQTSVYYSGGANAPDGVPPNCGVPQVTVTPPNGPPFAINPGSGRHQNSGNNPASADAGQICGRSRYRD